MVLERYFKKFYTLSYILQQYLLCIIISTIKLPVITYTQCFKGALIRRDESGTINIRQSNIYDSYQGYAITAGKLLTTTRQGRKYIIIKI